VFSQFLSQMSTVRRRLAIVASVTAMSAALLMVQSIAARKVVSDSFAQLENAQGERSLVQSRRALEADLHQLAISAHDYAVWDYAYAYAANHDRRFVDANLTPEMLANLNVGFVWVTDVAGQQLLSLQRSPPEQTGPLTAADSDIVAAVRRKLPTLLGAAAPPPLSRLFQTRRGILAVAAYPILPSSGKGEARGALVFGRFLDASVVARARATSELPLQLYLDRGSIAALPAPVRALWSVGRGQPERILVPGSASTLSGYQLLRDIDGAPAAIAGTSIERDLLAFGHHTGRSLIYIFSAVLTVFTVIICALLFYLDRARTARATSERRYRAVINQAHETMLLVDTRSRHILEANPAATSTLGFSFDELMQMDIDDLFFACDGDVLKPVHAEMHAAASDDRVLLVRCKDKRFIDVEVTASPLVIDGRNVTSFVLRDVSARKRAERELMHNQDKLAHLAHHDMLTGLLNRLGLERRLPEVIGNAARTGRSAAFMYIDLDHFKKVNDLQGHACGDRLLRIAAERLRECVSGDDLIVRMGGDEFVIVAGGLRNAQSANSVAARVLEELSRPFLMDGRHFKLTASIGVSVYPQDGADYEVLLKNADIALYESKEAGRGVYTVFSTEMTQKVTERVAFEVELRDALQSGQFYLDYQPLIDPRTQRVASLEALIRWHHPIHGRVPPLQFIGVAERTGMICDIGAFVISEVCRQIGEWQRAGLQPVPVAVNVSSKQLEQRTVIDVLQKSLQREQIPPSLLQIEITESVFMDASDRRIEHLNEIRALGVHVSVDDFGTGYSSLAYLKRLPVDCLKIDRAFTRDISASSADEAIVKAIIRMAQTLGLATVAEGVETQEQARRLTELGATYIQGFYFSPPLAADNCGRLLSQPLALPEPSDPQRLLEAS
jgi:diguanylate cyclase